MPTFFQNACAHHVPRVREHQHSRTVMQFSELLGFLGLRSNVHWRTSAGAAVKMRWSLGVASRGRNIQIGELFLRILTLELIPYFRSEERRVGKECSIRLVA